MASRHLKERASVANPLRRWYEGSMARNPLLIVAIILVVLLPASAQIVTHPRPQLKGGVTLEVEHAYDTTFDAVRAWLLRKDYAISVSDREAGQLVTMMAVITASAPTGEISQTGTRLMLTFNSTAPIKRS